MAIWRRFWVQKWPELAQNSLKWPQTTPKMVRNDVGTFLGKSISGHFGIILGSFWDHFGVILGHFGSFWVILGHFGSFWAQKMTKCCLQKPNMTPKPPSWPEKWLKIAFFLILYGKYAFLRILPSRISKWAKNFNFWRKSINFGSN